MEDMCCQWIGGGWQLNSSAQFNSPGNFLSLSGHGTSIAQDDKQNSPIILIYMIPTGITITCIWWHQVLKLTQLPLALTQSHLDSHTLCTTHITFITPTTTPPFSQWRPLCHQLQPLWHHLRLLDLVATKFLPRALPITLHIFLICTTFHQSNSCKWSLTKLRFTTTTRRLNISLESLHTNKNQICQSNLLGLNLPQLLCQVTQLPLWNWVTQALSAQKPLQPL